MRKGSSAEPPPVKKTRIYISQSDIPSYSLEKALKIPTAIGDNYGFKPSTPLQVAKALGVQPTSGGYRMLTGAAVAYGLTNGAYNAESIAITPLGMRIVRPTADDDGLAAKREALLRPRVIREFLRKYDGAALPKASIAHNVLMEMGVPQDRTADVHSMILDGASSVGFIQEINGRKYADLAGTAGSLETPDTNEAEIVNGDAKIPVSAPPISQRPPTTSSSHLLSNLTDPRLRRVFLTHGKNRDLIEPVKKLLAFGEMEAIVSVQKQTVSLPVVEKVMGEMRSCGAAIIHVEDERHLKDDDGKEHVVLNDNVLIEIGAAMAFFGQRFILVVKEGVKLPSNLQGLLELRYKGSTLDMDETVKLLEAVNDMKKRPLPMPTGASGADIVV